MAMCANHTSTEAVEGHVLCRLCLLKYRLAYLRRSKPPINRTCLRCGKVSRYGRKCKGPICSVCRVAIARGYECVKVLQNA